MAGMDLGSLLLIVAVVVVVLLALDLFAAGGAMTGGMMGGIAGMMGTPWGLGGFLLVLVVVLLLLAGGWPSCGRRPMLSAVESAPPHRGNGSRSDQSWHASRCRRQRTKYQAEGR